MRYHNWKAVFTETRFPNTHVNWCPQCGTVKLGPFSEPGAYNFYVYHIPGPLANNFPTESKEDPPCPSP